MAQTVGSASSSVASGVIFTLPALFLWDLAPVTPAAWRASVGHESGHANDGSSVTIRNFPVRSFLMSLFTFDEQQARRGMASDS